jgi:hypothetical protein
MDGLIFGLGINPLEQVAEPVDAGFVETLAWPGGHNLLPVSQASPIWLAARLLNKRRLSASASASFRSSV